MEYKDLSERILKFLSKYAKISAEYDASFDDEIIYASPDAAMLKFAADCLKRGQIPIHCWSEWGSGGYYPYTSKEGKAEHDDILKAIKQIGKL